MVAKPIAGDDPKLKAHLNQECWTSGLFVVISRLVVLVYTWPEGQVPVPLSFSQERSLW